MDNKELNQEEHRFLLSVLQTYLLDGHCENTASYRFAVFLLKKIYGFLNGEGEG